VTDDPNELRATLEGRTTDELVSILRNRDDDEWRPEVFDLVASVLAGRGVSPTSVSAMGPEGEDVVEQRPLATVARYFSPAEAHASRLALEAAGVEAWVVDEAMGTVYGVGVGTRLQVRVEEQARALAVLEGATSSSKRRTEMAGPTRCVMSLFVVLVATAGSATEISESSLRAADAEQMRIIVDGDAKAQSAFMHDNYIINGPSNRILRKPVLVEMLAHGRMASDRFERTIEGTAITGNIGIVMGSELVRPAAGSELAQTFGDRDLKRRFTNVFMFEGGAWRFLARQATVIEVPCK